MREKISKLIDFLPLPHYNYWLLYFFSFLEHCVFFNVINVYVPDTPSRKTRYSCLVLGPLFLSVSPHLKKIFLQPYLIQQTNKKCSHTHTNRLSSSLIMLVNLSKNSQKIYVNLTL